MSQLLMTTPQHEHYMISRQPLTWDVKFTKRNKQLYGAENNKIVARDGRTRLQAFLERRAHGLTPPQYSYEVLETFLSKASIDKLEGHQRIDPNSRDAEELVLLDERIDASSLNSFASRHWAEYAEHPPRGEEEYTDVLSAKGLYDRLKKDVCYVMFMFFGWLSVQLRWLVTRLGLTNWKRLHLGESSPERRSM